MSEAEAAAYFAPLGIILSSIFNFVDYDDIEAPFKSMLKPNQALFIDPNAPTFRQMINFKRHTFGDNTSRFQLL